MKELLDNPIALAALGLVSCLSIYTFIVTLRLQRLKQLLLNSGGQDLEAVLKALSLKQHNQQEDIGEIVEKVKSLQDKIQFVVQKIGVVRFNPFDDGGGNFSFSLALLDAYDNGVVITSMHGRQQNRIYSKQVSGGKSDHNLTEEEQRAIEAANNKFVKTKK